jgi:membrane-anchored mycosin MYCP
MSSLRLAVVVVLAVPLLSLVNAAPAQASAGQCAPPGHSSAGSPWAQQLLVPQQIWPLTSGGHQRVAVLDSGVDADQSRLHGRVEPGYDAITGHGSADSDCLGSGTAVAGVIAGAKPGLSDIYGMAPAATIVPVRVIGEPGPNMSATPTAAVLARGITWAAQQHVDVIDISPALTHDDPAVRQAVALALADDIVVVAAAGDLASTDSGDPVTYPAGYPGVIGVGAIDDAGQPSESSEHGPYVDLVAPGVDVPVLARSRGMVTTDGTAIAAGFVSGAAALIRARWPQDGRRQVTERLLTTASPAADLTSNGSGVVNPYLAVTATGSVATAAPIPGMRPSVLNPRQVAAAAQRRHSRSVAGVGTVIALGVLLIVALLAVGLPRARRSSWRPAYAPAPVERTEPIEPLPVPLLFDEPSAT